MVANRCYREFHLSPMLLPWRLICIVLTAALLSYATLSMGISSISADESGLEVATFAGGCFWCVESDFDHVYGVTRVISGYTGGTAENANYQRVSAGGTGHREAVQIFFDPKKVTYAALLEIFWRSIDPTDEGGQFCDRGDSYTTAILTNSPEQKRLAEESRQRLEQANILPESIATAIEVSRPFYPAEDYHQNYDKKNPLRYKLYRRGCGRDARVKNLWGNEAHRGIERN